MHWSRVFACLFFTTAFCNTDSGPAQAIALYLTRKFAEEAGLTNYLIAPDCPAPCEFKDFIQYVSPRNPKTRRPLYSKLDWSKLTDAALVDMQSAIGALQDIKYTGAFKDGLLLANAGSKRQHYSDVTWRVRTTISFSKAMLFAKGKNPSGGSFGLLINYWQAVADFRRKNLANHIVRNFEQEFKDKFGKPIEPKLGDPISHPPVASYQQLDLPGTLEKAKATEGLNAKDVEDFVNNFVNEYNSKEGLGGGKSHVEAIQESQNMVNCYR